MPGDLMQIADEACWLYTSIPESSVGVAIFERVHKCEWFFIINILLLVR